MIRWDLGPPFVNRLTEEFFKTFHIQQRTSVTDQHQSNGLVERHIRSLVEYLRLYTDAQEQDWISLLPYAEFVLNSSPSISLQNKSPLDVDLGYVPTGSEQYLFPESESNDITLRDVYDIRSKLEIADRTAKAAFNAMEERTNKRYDTVKSEVGNRIYVRANLLKASGDVNNRELDRSLRSKFTGPHQITEKNSPVHFTIDLPKSCKRPNLFHFSQLKRQILPEEGYNGPVPPAARAQVFKKYKDSESMEVIKIHDHKKKARGYLFEIEFADSTKQWKRKSNIEKTASELVQDYSKAHTLMNSTKFRK